MTDHQLIASLKRVQENIQTTMAELASLKEDMRVQSLKEERLKVFKFIEDSRKVGFTSDLSTMEEFIEKKFGLAKGRAAFLLIEYIDFTASIPVTSSLVVSEAEPTLITPVKRKGPKPYSEMTPEELVIAKAAKAAKMQKTEQKLELEQGPEQKLNYSSESTPKPVKEKRVLHTTKKSSDALKVWNSFLKIVQAEMESGGEKVKYDDVVKKAKEMKESDQEAYQLFSSTWTPEEPVLQSAKPTPEVDTTQVS